MSKKSLGVGITILIAVMLEGNTLINGEQSTLGKSANPLTQKGSKIIQDFPKNILAIK
ncbi:MAG TPA: hypothetical protein VF884_01590 [Nitrososphaeraceae archaeon]